MIIFHKNVIFRNLLDNPLYRVKGRDESIFKTSLYVSIYQIQRSPPYVLLEACLVVGLQIFLCKPNQLKILNAQNLCHCLMFQSKSLLCAAEASNKDSLSLGFKKEIVH